MNPLPETSPSDPSVPEPPAQGDPPSESPTAPHPAFPKVVQFSALARCGDEIWIENHGQIYRLRRTRQGKLILTK